MRKYVEALWPAAVGAGSTAVMLYFPTVAAIALGVVLIIGIASVIW